MATSQENLQHICSVNMYPTFQSLLENMSNNDYINLACAFGLRQPVSDSFKVSRKGRSVNCNSDVAPNLPDPIPFSFSNQCARAALSGEGIRRCQDGWRMRSAGSSMLCEADGMWEPFPSRFIPARHPDDRLSYGDIPGNICQTNSGQWREIWIPTMQETMDREYSATMCKSHSLEHFQAWQQQQQQQPNSDNNHNNTTYYPCQCVLARTFGERRLPGATTPSYANMCSDCATTTFNTTAVHPAESWRDELLHTYVVNGEVEHDDQRVPRKFMACPEPGCGQNLWGDGYAQTMARCMGSCRVRNRGGARIFKQRKVKEK